MREPSDAIVFDLYGTLVDYATLRDAFVSLAPDPDAFVTTWRQKQIAYSFAATLMDRYVDFDTLTGYAFDYAAALHGVGGDSDCRLRAIAAWSSLPAYAEVPHLLATLRERGLATAVLSNGTPAALAATLGAAKIADRFDAVLSVDTVRAYKPHPSVYALATKRFSTTPERITFVSSNGWDATGAAEFGFNVVWCNRAKLPPETFGARPMREIASLTDLLHE